MKIIYTFFLAAAIGAFNPAKAGEPVPDTSWFEEARLGMFIHFGPWAVLGAGEWVMETRQIHRDSYRLLGDFFDPRDFDPAEWVGLAKEAGMKYITFTSRHHDSFSNWDTGRSDWNIINTPYGKDLLRQLAEECARQGITLNLYYSTLDWMREDYSWRTGRTGQHSGRTDQGNWDDYIDFMKAQLTELLTGYGPIGAIWFDGHWDQTAHENRIDHTTSVDWHYPEIYGLIRELQPGCLIANNHHLPPLPGEDFQIFERDVPGENISGLSGQEVSRLPLETCETLSRSWGFSITDDQVKSPEEIIRLIVRTAGTGANLLLNVGPMPDGRIRRENTEVLQKVGKWMETYGETIYGTQAGPVKPCEWGAVTAKDDRLYIHILDAGAGPVTLPAMAVKSAVWMDSGNDVPWRATADTGEIVFDIALAPAETDAVIIVERGN